MYFVPKLGGITVQTVIQVSTAASTTRDLTRMSHKTQLTLVGRRDFSHKLESCLQDAADIATASVFLADAAAFFSALKAHAHHRGLEPVCLLEVLRSS